MSQEAAPWPLVLAEEPFSTRLISTRPGRGLCL